MNIFEREKKVKTVERAAVTVDRGHPDLILFASGECLQNYVDEMGRADAAIDLEGDLDSSASGIFVWEGTVTGGERTYDGDFTDLRFCGTFRRPSLEEAFQIIAGNNPWPAISNSVTEDEKRAIVGKVFRHYKGAFYMPLAVGIEASANGRAGASTVIYTRVPHVEGADVFTRDIDEFFENVSTEGGLVPRFEDKTDENRDLEHAVGIGPVHELRAVLESCRIALKALDKDDEFQTLKTRINKVLCITDEADRT